MADATKAWYLSKGVWAGIITALIGAGTSIALLFGVDLNSNALFGIIVTILGALGLYSRVTATTQIK
jgi:uncharacterized membrane protein